MAAQQIHELSTGSASEMASSQAQDANVSLDLNVNVNVNVATPSRRLKMTKKRTIV